MSILKTQAQFAGFPVTIACDGRCSKAWGISARPRNQLSDDVDDFEWLADDELGKAPEDPGTYEGGHAKPTSPDECHNKWCARECERSVMVDRGKTYALPDFSTRRANKG